MTDWKYQKNRSNNCNIKQKNAVQNISKSNTTSKGKNRGKGFCITVLCVLAGLLIFQRFTQMHNHPHTVQTSASLSSGGAASDFIEAEAVYVVDGDTLDVQIGSETVRVRLIGIDAPESSHPSQEENAPEGDTAAAYLTACFPAGTHLYLEKDISDTDIYGRSLYYVWTELPTAEMSLTQTREQMLNAKLVWQGYARTMEVPPDTSYSELFARLEENARRESAGLWKTGCWE